MENDLKLSEDISLFLDDFDLTKENVLEVIEYVHYKAILDSFTYVIESSKKSSDTGLFAMEYLEVTEKLGDILKKLIDKKNERTNRNVVVETK